jgi:antitoxin component YwqK of YwqJK toxin-antitoxin module
MLHGKVIFLGVLKNEIGVKSKDKKSSIIFETEYINDLRHGENTEYFPCGKIKQKCKYVNNKIHGYLTEYDISGNIVKNDLYEHGTKVTQEVKIKKRHIIVLGTVIILFKLYFSR